MGPRTARLDRRALLLGSGGLLLAACSGESAGGEGPDGSGSTTPKPSGPIINSQDAGTVISKEDLDALIEPLNAALRGGDLNAMRAVVPDLDTDEWQARLASMERFPLEDLGFVFEGTSDRTVNASGGKVDTTMNVVLTHRVAGCDARIVVQPYDVRVTKVSPGAPVTVGYLAGPHSDDAPWDLPGRWEVLESEHLVVATRDRHLAEVRGRLPDLDRGAADAMRFITPAEGITRMMVAVDEPTSEVFGGSELYERDGFATRMDYIDPVTAAAEGSGSSGETKGKQLYATSRIVLRPGALASNSRAYEIALHETLHGLALRWGPFAPPWVAEGVAVWGESGGAAGYRRSEYAALARAGFSSFASTFMGWDNSWNHGLFQRQDDSTVRRNYACSGAIFSAVEEGKGRKVALALAEGLYSDDVLSGPKKGGFRDQQALFDFAASWVGSL